MTSEEIYKIATKLLNVNILKIQDPDVLFALKSASTHTQKVDWQ